MITQKEIDEYRFQQTREGKEIFQALEKMKVQYCKRCNLRESAVHTGKLTAVRHCLTGEISTFIKG
jgi:hypothetical protein